MTQLTAISKESHAGKSWTRFESYAFASGDNLVSLVGAEVARAALAMPIAFIRQPDGFSLVAVLSLLQGRNMFVAPNGRWLGAYVPSVFRGYPFRLAKAEGREDLILCVDDASGLIRDDAGAEPFFDENGETSGPVKNILDFLSQVELNRAATQRAVTCLAEAGLIVDWDLTLRDGDRETPVKGLCRVDETGMNNLEDQDFLSLRKAGALPLAYGQLLSMGNIHIFDTLAGIHRQISAADPARIKEPDLKAVFEDDIIRFSD